MMDTATNGRRKTPLSLQIDPTRFAPATDAEKAQQLTQRESTSFMRDAHAPPAREQNGHGLPVRC